MVSLTDSELDCVMKRRPLARCRRARRLVAQGGDRAGELLRDRRRVVHRVAPRFSFDIFCRPNLTTERPDEDGIWLESSPYRRRGTAPTRFVAEAEKFRTRSLGERARMPQEREIS
jgi:hypothetical protein